MKLFIVIICFISIGLVSEEPQQCPLYEKYKNKMSSDPGDAQVWSMCAGAALEACRSVAENVKRERLEYYANQIKRMVTEGSPCPCSDVISSSIWNGSKTTGSSNGTGFPKSTAYPEYNGTSGSSYKELLKQADEYYYSGDHKKALELYKAASKANNGSDAYLKNRIASLSQSAGKTTGSGTANSNKPQENVNSYIDNLLKNGPPAKTPPGIQSGNLDRLIDQYERILNEYVTSFRNSLSENVSDVNVFLEKNKQLDQIYEALFNENNTFTESQLTRIASISENFSDALLNLANSYGVETMEENRRYVRARGVELPKSLLQVPGAYAVDPNPKQNSGGYTTPPNSNSLPASVTVRPQGDFAPKKLKEKKK